MAVTSLARNVAEIFAQLFARPFAFGFTEAALDVGDDAFERFLGVVRANPILIRELDLIITRAEQDRVLRFLRQVLPLGIKRELVKLAERLQRLNVIRRR